MLPSAAPGVALARGQQANAAGVVFTAPVAGNYVTASPCAGWPCMPGGSNYVVHGTVASAGALGAAGASATVLVTGQQASGGRAKAGAAPGAYKAWPYAGSKVLTVVP